ncbi:MAG: mechanosensitive ion channel family protein [Ignavibacteriales bacterium]|nr:mechanosensitive ion channel family protein [Ignavibacteriales bacterium]
MGPLLAGSAILTAVLGLALQGVLGNIFSGMSLHYTRSFSRGDWVRIGETEGQVVDTNWRETRLKDRASNIVVIPNTVVASQTITNFSLPDRPSAVTLPIKVDVLAPPAAVLGLLVEAAQEAPDVLAEPAPTAYHPQLRRARPVLRHEVLDRGLRPQAGHRRRGRPARLVQAASQRRRDPRPRREQDRGRPAHPAAVRGPGRRYGRGQEMEYPRISRGRRSSAFRRARRPASPSSRKPRCVDLAAGAGRARFGAAGGPLPAGRNGGRLLHRRQRPRPGARSSMRRAEETYTTSFEVGRGRPRRRDVALHRPAADGHRGRRRRVRAPRDPGRSPGFAPRPQSGPGRSHGRRSSAPGTGPTARRFGRSRTWPPGTSRRARTRRSVLEYLKRLVHLFRR